MKSSLILAQMMCAVSICCAQWDKAPVRLEAEYYVTVYAQHYRVPIALARAIVVRESNWQPCVISLKGAVGLMQLMPAIAKRLGVTDRCNLDQNVSGGVRYLACLCTSFITTSGSWPLPTTPAKKRSEGEDLFTEIPTSLCTSQQLEQLTFEKPPLNQKAKIPLRKEM